MPSGHLTLLSPGAAQFLGGDAADELVAFTRRLDARDQGELLRACTLVAVDGRTRECEHEAFAGDGRRRLLRSEIHRTSPALVGRASLFATTFDVTDDRAHQAHLELSERQLSVMLRKAPLVVFTLDLNGRVTFADGRDLTLLGLDRGSLVGARLAELVADAAWLTEALELGAGDRSEVVRSGWLRGRYLEVHLAPMVIGGAAVAKVGVINDISDRAERMFVLEHTARALAEASGRRAAFLADASRILASSFDHYDAISRVARLCVPYLADWCVVDLLDAEGRAHRPVLAHADPADDESLRQLGGVSVDLDASAGIGRVLSSGRPELRADLTVDQLRVDAKGWSPAGARTDPELELVRRLGMSSCLTLPLTTHGRTLGAVTLVLAARDRAFGPIDVQVATDLASRVAIAIENAELYQRSQAAILARDEFLSIAAHELRTPLTALDLAVRSLRLVGNKGSFGAYEKQARDALAAAERQSRRMEKLVESLLDVARLSSGSIPLALESMDLVEVAREVLAQFDEEALRTECELHFDAPSPVFGRWDRSLVEQIVGNLLSNGCKYGSGHPVEVTVFSSEDAAVVEVRDEGIGIAPEVQPRIFDRFERAVSPHHYGGLGLGLYIVKRGVERLGGTVSVHSAPGEGATFRVELPKQGPHISDDDDRGRPWAGLQ